MSLDTPYLPWPLGRPPIEGGAPEDGEGSTETTTTADTQDVDWQKRYLDLQPEYTRTTQELAGHRKLLDGEDPDGFQALLAKYGYEVEDSPEEPEDDEPTYEDDEPSTDPRLDRFEQFMAEQQQAQQQQAYTQQWAGWAEYVTNEAKEAGVELAPHEIKALSVDCRDNDGFPVAPEKAKKILKGYLDETREPWIEQITTARKKPRVPHTPTGGQPPADGKDPSEMTRQERQQYMLDRLRAEQA